MQPQVNIRTHSWEFKLRQPANVENSSRLTWYDRLDLSINSLAPPEGQVCGLLSQSWDAFLVGGFQAAPGFIFPFRGIMKDYEVADLFERYAKIESLRQIPECIRSNYISACYFFV